MEKKDSDFPADVAKEIARIIDKAEHNVFIVSGKLPSLTYNNPNLTTAVGNALKKGVNFQVMVGPDYDQGSRFFLEKLSGNIFEAPSRPTVHFTVCDSKLVRYEGKHSEDVTEPPNHIEMNMPHTGNYLTNIFLEAKKSCKLLV